MTAAMVFKMDISGLKEQGVEATPAAVELQHSQSSALSVESSAAESVGGDAEANPGKQPESMVWMMQAAGRRDSVGDFDLDSPDNPRASRMSVANIASDEDIALEMQEEVAKDTKAGVKRPPNYTKLGGKLPFRVPRKPDDLTPLWLTTAFRFKKMLTDDASVTDVSYKQIGEAGGYVSWHLDPPTPLGRPIPSLLPPPRCLAHSPRAVDGSTPRAPQSHGRDRPAQAHTVRRCTRDLPKVDGGQVLSARQAADPALHAARRLHRRVALLQ